MSWYKDFFSSPITEITQKKFVADVMATAATVTGSETFPELYERARLVLDKIEKIKLDNILLVAHENIGKMISAVYHNWTWEEGLKKLFLDNAEIIVLSDKADVVPV